MSTARATRHQRATAILAAARAEVPAPIRYGHTGAQGGHRYVSRDGFSLSATARTAAARVGVALLVLVAILGVTGILGAVGHEDLRSVCFDALHTDVVSAEHTTTVQSCHDAFGPRGY